jgi:hypothetical protein
MLVTICIQYALPHTAFILCQHIYGSLSHVAASPLYIAFCCHVSASVGLPVPQVRSTRACLHAGPASQAARRARGHLCGPLHRRTLHHSWGLSPAANLCVPDIHLASLLWLARCVCRAAEACGLVGTHSAGPCCQKGECCSCCKKPDWAWAAQCF